MLTDACAAGAAEAAWAVAAEAAVVPKQKAAMAAAKKDPVIRVITLRLMFLNLSWSIFPVRHKRTVSRFRAIIDSRRPLDSGVRDPYEVAA
jgi:hypothetical protein